VNDYDQSRIDAGEWDDPDEHDGRKDECVCDWSGLPGDFDPDPACPQHGRTEPVCLCSDGGFGHVVSTMCPFHGERPWAVCELCNYDRHQCPGCGQSLRHGGPIACNECDTDDLPPRGLIVYESGENPYDLPPELFAGWSSGAAL
jgi:hypothetical protein